jgi:acyl transferase domain-containing protein/thioesterase domain-containing protein
MSDETDDASAGSRIAVIGMAGRFPGSPDIAAYWKNLCAGVESVKFFTDEELLAAGESPEALRDPSYVKAWPVLDDIDQFDAAFFGMGPRDAAVMDPQHRLFLETAWSALEHAGYAPETQERSIGVFAACGMNTYMMYHLVTNAEIMSSVGEWLVRHTGNDMNFLATRVSYQMNLRGPSLNVQTACSSSLVAVHLACQSLLNGECDVALAGASTLSLPQNKGYFFKEGEILSPDGHCRPFDAGSRGTLFGSGTGCVVLKRLSDARADGDNVLGVILGSAINNDGSQKVGYLAPSVDGQARAISEALTIAGVEPDTISYVETHGTGTAVGDPIEMAALTQAYAAHTDERGFCGIGSVKGNIGHLGEAAGMAGIIKSMLALQHKQLPPSINYRSPNPQIDFAASPFFVNDKLTEWRAKGGQRRRAGLTALGAGGTNVHVILEEAPPPAPAVPARKQQLLVLSAKTATALERAAENLANHLEADAKTNAGLALADVAYTLQTGRKAFAHRRIVSCDGVASAVAGLRATDVKTSSAQLQSQSAPSVIFMFPGGGAQYADMGRDLYDGEPVYRAAVDECLATVEPARAAKLRALIFPPQGKDNEDRRAAASQALTSPSLALPALFATEYAMAKLLLSWGVEPTAFIGHSMGEYVAACLAGVFSVRDGVALVSVRGRLFETLPAGGMLSVQLSEAELAPLLGPELSIAAVNTPELCVASGPVEALDRLEKTLAAREVETTRIHISVAAHSKMLEPILAEFEAFFRGIRLAAPTIPFVSNVTGTWITPEQATAPSYWVSHLRSTVRFAQGISELVSGGPRVLVEIGPGRTLSSLARMNPGAPLAVPSIRHPQEEANDVSFLLQTVGRIWMSGAKVDFGRLQGEGRRRVPLPTYAFDRKRYWIEAGQPMAAKADGRRALQKKPDLGSWFYRPTWKPSTTPAPDEAVGGTWLLFCDAAGVAERLATRLPDKTLIRVFPGEAYGERADGSYELRPDAREDFEALIQELVAQERAPDHIVYLWPVSAAKRDWTKAGLAKLAQLGLGRALAYEQAEPVCFAGLLHLAQTVGPLEKPMTLSVVSTGLQGVNGLRRVEPEKALLLGPVRVIPREFPHINTRSLDLSLPFNPALAQAAIDRLAEELCAPAQNEIVALHGLQRWTQSFEAVPLGAAPATHSPVRRGGVYLITGGLGGIGLELALHLATTARAKLVLLGRAGLPARADWPHLRAAGGPVGQRIDKVCQIEAAGGEVLALAADVTSRDDLQRVQAAVRARFGRLHGIIHSAGLIDDGLISLKLLEAARRVLAVKAKGAIVLDEVFGRDPLEFFVVFSSVSSVLGLEGQIDYTAANAFLDAFAEQKAADGRTLAVSMAWNAWQEIGMAAALAGPSAAASPATPWWERLAVDSPDESLFVTSFARGKQWVLSEHVVKGGEALIPGTGYLELAREALARSGAPRPFELRDLTFLSPFVVTAGETRDLQLRLARRDGGVDVGERELTFFSRSADEPHVTGRIRFVDEPAPPPVDVATLVRRCAAREQVFDGFLDQSFMDFGPRWANVERVHFGADEAVIVLALPEAFASDLDDFKLHPALLDMATGGAQSLIAGFDPDKDFYVPFGYGRFTTYAPLRRRMFSHVRAHQHDGKDVAVFDVTIYGEDGHVLVDAAGFTMKRVSRAFSVVRTPTADVAAPVSPGVRDSFGESKLGAALKLGMLPAEGMQAFDRILSTRVPGHVIASSVDLLEWLAQVETQARRATPGASTGGQDDDAGFARPNLGAEFVAPRNDVERTLASMWREVLGLKQVGIHDDFFELGGQSLVAVRLFNKIRKRFGVDLPLSTLFDAPTIERCARVLAAEAGIALVDDGDAAVPAPGDASPPDVVAVASPTPREADPHRWFLRSTWRQRQRDPKKDPEKHTWLAFVDNMGVVSALAERLRRQGHDVITVREGDAFHKLSESEYQLFPEEGADGYEALLREVFGSGKAPTRILHAWLLTDRETFRPGSSFLHRNLELGFYSLLYLAQALAKHETRKPLHLVTVTTGMQRVGKEALRYPEKAAAIGPSLVIPKELPGVTSSVVDIAVAGRDKGLRGLVTAAPAEDEALRQLVDALEAEVLARPRDLLVALRGSARWVADVERVSLDKARHAGFKERGVYLISGGLDGLGFSIAQQLATRHRARLVLVDRAPRPERVRALEALGAEVFAATAEVTNLERMREILREAETRFGRVDGVLHLVGAGRPAPLVSKQLTDVESVFSAGIYGPLGLHEVLRERPLDFLVLGSATAVIAAAAGQVDAVAATAFLDAFAETLESEGEGRRVVAIDWESGTKPDIGRELAPGISPEDGFAALERALRSSPHAALTICSLDLAEVQRRLRGAAPLPGLVTAAPDAAAHGGTEPAKPPAGAASARLKHLVKIHPGHPGPKAPLFLVAGLFGNVLNLRHLGLILGADRPVYGLQARGLFGGLEPHETFEEMARDYLVELRTVQPTGPYLLGGFSGGGLTAYEMARQLTEAGEHVRLVVLLDTPVPRRETLSLPDRLSIQAQNLRREGSPFLRRWVADKLAYRRILKERDQQLRVQRGGGSHDFHSQVIEAAFYRALARYEMRSVPVPVALFRPVLRPTYRLSRGRMLDHDRSALYPDNGWSPYVERLDIREVPGDHDGMVLEPNVRVLAARIAEAIDQVEAPTGERAHPAGTGKSRNRPDTESDTPDAK